MSNLAYLFPAFPVFHQTFVLWEVMGLHRNGLRPQIYSMRRPSGQQQPEGQQLVSEVTYLPGLLSVPVLRANWRLLRRAPARYLRLYGALVAAWRSGASSSPRDVGWAQRRVSFSNRVRGWLNSQPLLYLLKSLALVPTAVYLAEELARQRITHLHVHWASYPATVAYVVHLVSALPFSISAHAYDIYMVPRMLPAKLRAARFLVTCAQTNADFLRRLADAELHDKIIVSYHGVDVSRFAPAAMPASPHQGLRIVSCGQLERYKGMHLLVDACAALAQRGIDLECWIVGEGPERGALERRVAEHGLQGRVHLTGARPHAAVAELYRTADVFALASELAGKSGRRDVIANVTVEAMAAGLPVVVSAIPGVEELVEQGVTGYTVPPNDAGPLADTIAYLAANPAERERVGQAARRRVLRDFDNGKNVRLLVDLLLKAAEPAHQPLAACSA